MTQEHPITPPPELVYQWADEHFASIGWIDNSGDAPGIRQAIAIQAARWGADMELDACCSWVEVYAECSDPLRAARRPKPPSLKEQALALLDDASDRLDAAHENIIRRALESLPD